MCEVIEPLTLIFSAIRPNLYSIGTFLPLRVNIATVECILLYLNILHILQVIVINHLLQFLNLLLRSAVVLRRIKPFIKVKVLDYCTSVVILAIIL